MRKMPLKIPVLNNLEVGSRAHRRLNQYRLKRAKLKVSRGQCHLVPSHSRIQKQIMLKHRRCLNPEVTPTTRTAVATVIIRGSSQEVTIKDSKHRKKCGTTKALSQLYPRLPPMLLTNLSLRQPQGRPSSARPRLTSRSRRPRTNSKRSAWIPLLTTQ